MAEYGRIPQGTVSEGIDLPPAVTANPFFTTLGVISAVGLLAVLADTSHGSPLTLTATSGTKPFFVAPYFSPHPQFPNAWLNPDTSHGTAKPLIPDATPPFVPAPNYSPLRFFWQPQDSSAGIPKGLQPEKTLPFFTFNQPALALQRNVKDTTRGTPAFLFPVSLPPGFALQLGAPAYQFQVVNTSQASNAIYYPPTPIVAPPAGNAILWIVGPKGIKTKIRFISGTEPEKES